MPVRFLYTGQDAPPLLVSRQWERSPGAGSDGATGSTCADRVHSPLIPQMSIYAPVFLVQFLVETPGSGWQIPHTPLAAPLESEQLSVLDRWHPRVEP